MRLRTLLSAAILALACASSAFAHEQIYETLLSGPAEAPPNASPGTGYAKVTFDLDLITMRVEANFSGLIGTTSAAHIHSATAVPFAGTAGVATQTPSFVGFPLGVTSGVYDHTYDMTLAASYNASFITNNGGTVATALNALLSGLDSGKAYFNVHTSAFPGGEIRGFLVPIPEPSTWALLSCGAAGLGLIGWRKRAALASAR